MVGVSGGPVFLQCVRIMKSIATNITAVGPDMRFKEDLRSKKYGDFYFY